MTSEEFRKKLEEFLRSLPVAVDETHMGWRIANLDVNEEDRNRDSIAFIEVL